MSYGCLLRYSFIIPFLIKTEKTEEARQFFSTYDSLFTSIAVYEETFYVGLRLIASDRLGIKNAFSFRNYIRKNGYVFAEDLLKLLSEVFSNIHVVNDIGDTTVIQNIATKYRLLPNDALITATCRHYGIKKIATFDEDFKRVDFLEVIDCEQYTRPY